MTAKELLLEQVPTWSEHDAEVALAAVEHEHQAESASNIDEWGDLDAQTYAATIASMREMDEEEAAIGFSWPQREPA